jgi:hypothetical protein
MVRRRSQREPPRERILTEQSYAQVEDGAHEVSDPGANTPANPSTRSASADAAKSAGVVLNSGREPTHRQKATRDAILRETTLRLVSSRAQEVEFFKAKLAELSLAMAKVNEIRMELETRINRDLAAVYELSKATTPFQEGDRTFSQYFQALIHHFNAQVAEKPEH